VTACIVPDSLKAAVTTPSKWEPDLNSEFFSFAEYYGTVILPARAGESKDKALFENAVKILYTRIFAPLRKVTFYSLKELNEAIREFFEKHNNIPFKRLKTTRYNLFMEIEKNKLKPLPQVRYEFKKFNFIKVAFNYHVYLAEDSHYYSVPYRFAGKKVKLPYTGTAVQIYHENIRIAFHRRDRRASGYTTNKDYMPSHHKYYFNWNPGRITGWAAKVGQSTK